MKRPKKTRRRADGVGKPKKRENTSGKSAGSDADGVRWPRGKVNDHQRAARIAMGLAGDPSPDPTIDATVSVRAYRDGNFWRFEGEAELWDLGDALRAVIPCLIDMYETACGTREREKREQKEIGGDHTDDGGSGDVRPRG